jgi:hypothetical protein
MKGGASMTMTIILVTDNVTRTKTYVEAVKESYSEYQLNYVEVTCRSTDLHDHLLLVDGYIPEATEAIYKAAECGGRSMIVIDSADAGMTAMIFHDIMSELSEEIQLSEDWGVLDNYTTEVALIVSGELHVVT